MRFLFLSLLCLSIAAASQEYKKFISKSIDKDSLFTIQETISMMSVSENFRMNIPVSGKYKNELVIFVDQEITHKTTLLYLVRFDNTELEIFSNQSNSFNKPVIGVDSSHRIFKEIIKYNSQIDSRFYYQKMIVPQKKKKTRLPKSNHAFYRKLEGELNFAHFGFDYVEYRDEPNYPSLAVKGLVGFIKEEVMMAP